MKITRLLASNTYNSRSLRDLNLTLTLTLPLTLYAHVPAGHRGPPSLHTCRKGTLIQRGATLALSSNRNPSSNPSPNPKALSPWGDTLVAYEMNGEDISREHGYPVPDPHRTMPSSSIHSYMYLQSYMYLKSYMYLHSGTLPSSSMDA